MDAAFNLAMTSSDVTVPASAPMMKAFNFLAAANLNMSVAVRRIGGIVHTT